MVKRINALKRRKASFREQLKLVEARRAEILAHLDNMPDPMRRHKRSRVIRAEIRQSKNCSAVRRSPMCRLADKCSGGAAFYLNGAIKPKTLGPRHGICWW